MNRPAPLLDVIDLHVCFSMGRRTVVHAVSGVSLALFEGETLGLVGESGCGKTTVARTIVRLQAPSAGAIHFGGRNLIGMTGRRLRAIRPDLQMIFQNAAASLNPGRRAGKSVVEPLRVSGRGTRSARTAAARAMLAEVGIDPDAAFARRPFAFSNGQCQRISIARALITDPRLLICDEPVSALDVSVQAQILNLLRRLKASRGLTMLFISHDLAVIRNICDRVAVMYMGRICETAPVADLFRTPRHPYTVALLSAVPALDGRRKGGRPRAANGMASSPAAPPSGCRYHPRCPFARDRCAADTPPMTHHAPGHAVACHHPMDG